MSALEFDTPSWPAAANIKAVTSTRLGGLSEDVYAELNLGAHVGDDPARVKANRQRLMNHLSLPSEPVWLNQVHGTQILDLDRDLSKPADGSLVADGSLPSAADGSLLPAADGSLTRKVGTVCAIMTADCMPVFLCDRAGTEVALVHAGWRGLAAGIVEQAVTALNANPEDVLVWAGPSIGPMHFEVGQEVRDALGGSERSYSDSENDGKLVADLYQLLSERLAKINIGHYSHSVACTYADKRRYFSYRRDGQCGRMASLIWMDS